MSDPPETCRPSSGHVLLQICMEIESFFFFCFLFIWLHQVFNCIMWCHMGSVPWPGIKPELLALGGESLATGPSGKSQELSLLISIPRPPLFFPAWKQMICKVLKSDLNLLMDNSFVGLAKMFEFSREVLQKYMTVVSFITWFSV